jgi:hypothetical protein
MERAVVTLPDGRIAIPLEPSEAKEAKLSATSVVDVSSWRGVIEAKEVNPYRHLSLSELTAVIAQNQKLARK